MGLNDYVSFEKNVERFALEFMYISMLFIVSWHIYIHYTSSY